MAVTALSRTSAPASLADAALPLPVVLIALAAPALDLLHVLQPAAALRGAAVVMSAAAALVLLGCWAHYPRLAWLAAATLAGGASLALRLGGAEAAAGLSLLAVLALGVGGAFASPAGELEALFEPTPAATVPAEADFNPGSRDDTGVAAPQVASGHRLPPRAA
jgi:hypothetical protein